MLPLVTRSNVSVWEHNVQSQNARFLGLRSNINNLPSLSLRKEHEQVGLAHFEME